MIIWCRDQDVFCATWCEIQTLEKLIPRTSYPLHKVRKQHMPTIKIVKSHFSIHC